MWWVLRGARGRLSFQGALRYRMRADAGADEGRLGGEGRFGSDLSAFSAVPPLDDCRVLAAEGRLLPGVGCCAFVAALFG